MANYEFYWEDEGVPYLAEASVYDTDEDALYAGTKYIPQGYGISNIRISRIIYES